VLILVVGVLELFFFILAFEGLFAFGRVGDMKDVKDAMGRFFYGCGKINTVI